MVPASSYWAARADRQYVVGEVYRMVEHHDRSGESHRHYFATLANGWANLPDDKLPHRPMREVELADALIRICDLAGAYGMDLGGAVAEKLAYNAHRADHKVGNRQAEGGKSY